MGAITLNAVELCKNPKELQRQFAEHCKRHPSLEQNFALSHVDTMAAFLPGGERFTGVFAVLDMSFSPLFTHITGAYIHCCSISDDGNWAACQTASAESEDGSCIFLFDISNRHLQWKTPSPFRALYTRGIFIDPQAERVFVHCKDITLQYAFSGELLRDATFEDEYIRSKGRSPYELVEQANLMIESLSDSFDAGVEREIVMRLNAAQANPRMSHYQLSLAYRNLADCYYRNELNQEALQAYRQASQYNPNIGRKKIMRKLEES